MGTGLEAGRGVVQLTNEFEVAVPQSRAWELLTDVERIAPCLPGAALTGQTPEGAFKGTVKVKVGPIAVQYRGTAVFVEQRPEDGVLVLRAEGQESRGQGKASATVEAHLSPRSGTRTAVSVTTDLAITGKVAQFGRGVLADVSGGLLAQFASNLDRMLSEAGTDTAAAPSKDGVPAAPAVGAREEPSAAPATPGHPGTTPSGGAPATAAPIRQATPAADQGLDLLRVVAVPVAKRAAPVLGALVLLFVLARRRRRRGR